MPHDLIIRGVTPVFIDLHTHVDAQIGWDLHVSPVSCHGVTATLFSNPACRICRLHPGSTGRGTGSGADQ